MNLREGLDVSLYLVADPDFIPDHDVEKFLEDCASSGISLVQVRAKNLSDAELLSLCSKALRVLRPLNIPLIVNDRIEVALASGAQGVHLGQTDGPWRHARHVLGNHAVIGVSVDTKEQALSAEHPDVDYLGVTLFPTKSKIDGKGCWGLAGLRALRKSSTAKLVGIGGIDERNARDVLDAGADGIAVMSALCSSANPRVAAQKLAQLVKEFFAERR